MSPDVLRADCLTTHGPSELGGKREMANFAPVRTPETRRGRDQAFCAGVAAADRGAGQARIAAFTVATSASRLASSLACMDMPW